MEKLVSTDTTKKTKFIVEEASQNPAKIKPLCNQVEIHPYFPQRELVDFCQENGIHVTAFMPLGCVPIPALVGRTGPGPLEDAKIAEIAARYSTRKTRTPAQVILCYLLSRDISVIPKSISEQRILENFDCEFQLADADIQTMDNLVGKDGGQPNLESLKYLGGDNYNEDKEWP